MEIWRRAGLPVALIAVAICILNVTGEAETAPLDLSIPDDPGEDGLAENVLSLEGNLNGPFSEIPNMKMKLNYHPGWTLHMKQMKMNAIGLMKATGDYDHFPSVRYRDGNFEDSISDLKTCQRRCDAEKNCESYSFNNAEGLCNLSGDGVKYDPSYIYYEKNDLAKPMKEDTGKKKPTKIATPEEEEEEEEPHFTPPDDSELNAKLEATRERVEQVDNDLKNPDPALNLNRKKELADKQAIKVTERHNLRSVTKIRLQNQEIHNLDKEVNTIDSAIYTEKVSAPDMLKEVAKEAFAEGFRMAAVTGKASLAHREAEILDERRKAVEAYTGTDPNAAMTKLRKQADEKLKKRESLVAFKKMEREKERKAKTENHVDAMVLSKQGAALIASEAKSKQAASAVKESKVKSRHMRQNRKLTKAAEERGTKSISMLKASEKQSKAMEHFKLTSAIDNESNLSEEIIHAKERRSKKKGPSPEEERARRIEATSGVRERAAKDEKKERDRQDKVLARAAYKKKVELAKQQAELEDFKKQKAEEDAKKAKKDAEDQAKAATQAAADAQAAAVSAAVAAAQNTSPP